MKILKKVLPIVVSMQKTLTTITTITTMQQHMIIPQATHINHQKRAM